VKPRDPTPADSVSPLRLFVKVLAAIFFIGILTNKAAVFLPAWLPLSGSGGFVGSVLQAGVLAGLIAPFLWWWAVRPVHRIARGNLRAAMAVAHAVDGVITVNEQGLVELFNPAAGRIFGYRAAEILGKPLALLIPERYREEHRKKLEEVRETGKPEIVGETLELQGLRKDGGEFPVEVSLATWRAGEEKHYTAVVRDVIHRKQTEEALRTSQRLLERTFASLRDAVFIVGTDRAEIVACNPAASEIFGFSRDEMLGRQTSLLHVDEPALEEFRRRLYSAIAERGILSQLEFRMKRKDGTVFPTEHSVIPLEDEHGKRLGWVSVVRDLTERKRAEEALRGEYAFRKAIEESMFVGVATVDLEGRQTSVNPAFCRMVGWSQEELVGAMSPFVYWPPEDVEAIARIFQASISGWAMPGGVEVRFRRCNGERFDVLMVVSPMTDGQGKTTGWVMVLYDVTERKRAEEALRESEGKLKTLFEILPVGVSVLDAEREILYANPALERILGVSTEGLLNGDYRHRTYLKPDGTPMPAEEFASARAIKEQRAVRNVETGVVKEDGNVVWTVVSAVPVAFPDWKVVIVTSDITERKQAEAALRTRTQQLETVRAINEEIARELDLRAVLDLITHRAVDLVGASSAMLRLWQEDTSLLVPQSWVGLEERRGTLSLRLGEGVAGAVAQRRQGLVVNDFRHSPYATPLLLERTTHPAVLAEPLLYRDRLIGVINLIREESGRPFTEEDRELLVLFASQAAIAIENARSHSAAVRRTEELRALLRATRSVMAGLDLKVILDRILGEAAQIAETPHVKVLLVDGRRQVLRLAAVGGRAPEMLAEFSLPLGTGLSGIVAMTAQPLFVPDCQHDPRNVYAEQDRQLGLVTYLGLPITIRGDIVGVLTLNTEQPRRYSPEELAYLASFADQVAVAIENARLFEQVRDGRERLQIVSRRLVEIQEAERRTIARELHDEIGQLLTGLKLLLGMSARLKPEKVKPRLSEAQALANELMARVRELSLDLRPAMLDDLGLLPALLWHFERYTARTNVRVDFEHSGLERRFLSEIETAAYRIVQEALTNVARHANVHEVTVDLRADEHTLSMRIDDRGRGFDPEVALAASGSVGLVGMRERAALLGGRLTVTSTPGRGTQVMAELPLTSRFEKRGKPR
jgi:PAS domain S-box-containing protein